MTMQRPYLTISLVALMTAGCASDYAGRSDYISAQSAPVSGAPMPDEMAGIANPAIWPSPEWPIARDPAEERRIDALLAEMTIEEKVGQVIQGDISTVTPEDVRTYNLGSVLNGGNSGPGGNDLAPAREWLALADQFYDASIDKGDGGVGIPLIWGTDAVHGHSNIVGATLFPHNIGLGAARDPDLIERIGAATALEIRATGQEWTFAPTVTVPQDFRWGRAYEGYSSNPALVAEYTGRMIDGLQGELGAGPLLEKGYVLASTKHFLADGGTQGGKDQGDARIPETVLRDIHGAPYVPAIERGVATVMASYSSWNGVKMHGSRSMLTDVLKNRMNFDGFVVGDWNGHGQIAGCTNTDCPQAINAGLDMYMAPDSWKGMYESLNEDVRDGTVPMARLDDAVRRIVRVKMRLGLFDAGRPSSRPYSGDWETLGSAEHRALAREAVRKSLVLLKNTGSALPIQPGARVLVTGAGADDIAQQSGGWTLTWQGTGIDNSDFPGATSIWGGLKQAVEEAGGSAILSDDGSYAARPDVAIVVFGEEPYAEFQGDRPNLQLASDLRALETMRALQADNVPVVAVMLTGRPLFVNPELNIADAFVVAWLPGSEGGGVADLLVAGRDGRTRYTFTGKLPAAWPSTAAADSPALFDFGYGLTGAMKTAWQPLSEESGVAETGDGKVYFAKGEPAAAWSLQVGRPGGSPTRVTSVPGSAADGLVRVTAVDADVQEGGRQFAISDGPATIALSTQAPIDISRETNGDVLLTFTMRIDTAPRTAPTLSMMSSGSSGQIALSGLASTGDWTTYGVPLKCFAGQGVDMGTISVPFALQADGPAVFSLSRVALGTAVDRTLACTGTQGATTSP